MQLKLLKKKFTMKRCMVWLINLINIFVLLLSQMMINPVYADNDSEWLQLNDIETWNSYNFWNGYGLTADSSSSYTETLNSISSSNTNGSFTFSGTFNGTVSAGVSATVTGSIGDPKLGVAGIVYNGTSHIHTVDAKPIEITLHPTENGSEADYAATYSCSYYPNTTAPTATMSCVPNNSSYRFPLILPDYEVQVDSLEVYSSETGSMLIDLLVDENVVGQLSGSLSLSGSGSGNFSMSESGTSTTTSINVNSLTWTMPLMKGTLNNEKNLRKRLLISPDDYTSIYVLTTSGISFSTIFNNIYDYTTDSVLNDFIDIKYIDSSFYRFRGGFNLAGIRLKSKDNTVYRAYLEFVNHNIFNSNGFIPLYVGMEKYMSDDLYRFIFGSDRLIELLETGNSGSQSAASNLQQQKQTFEGATSDLVNLESDTFSGVYDAIGNVQVNNNVLVGNGFLNAANWVRVQFDNLTSYPAFNSVLVFSLSLGFALLIIGKVR